MFQTGIDAKVTGRSVKPARKSHSPDGKVIAEVTLACGNGSVAFPSMYIKVCLWEKVAEKVLAAINKKGLNIEVSGWLHVRQYEGKYGKSMLIELKNVRELKLFDRQGELIEVLNGD